MATHSMPAEDRETLGAVAIPTNGAHTVENNDTDRQSTVVNISGFQYTRAWASLRKVVYRCSVYRSTGCRAKIEYVAARREYVSVHEHTCRRGAVHTEEVRDVSAEMGEAVDRLALANLATPALLVWNMVDEEFYQGVAGALRGLTQQQVVSRVYRARARHFGGNIHGRIEVPPLSRVRDQDLNFFQFHYISLPERSTVPSRIIGWAHPHLMQLLRYAGTTVFIDGTFRCVPRGFRQCIILMVHDRATGFYVPVYYVLATNKTTDTYWDILHLIIQASDQRMEPAEVVCDFEAGLIQAVQIQFPNADVVGCLFHFKQAVRRRMKRIGISDAVASLAMERGVLDALSVMPPGDVATVGVAWVKQQIKQRCRDQNLRYTRRKWATFWAYFRRTWIDRFTPDVWNVHGMSNRIIARTNNPLERFNREMNTAFASPHPNMATFVHTIEELARRHVATLEAVRGRRAARRTVETIALAAAPDTTGVDPDASSTDEEDGEDEDIDEEPGSDSGLDEREEDLDDAEV